MEGDTSLKPSAVAGFTSLPSGQAERVVLWNPEFVPMFRPIALADFFVLYRCSDVLLLAIFANPASEALGENSQHRIGKTKRIAAHIEKSSNGFHRAVCVECAHDKVPG